MTLIFDEKTRPLDILLRELSLLEPSEIAQRLNDEGIRGEARACTFCPMANYLNKKLNGAHFVTLEKIYVLDENYDLNDDVYVDTPETVRKFAQQFDAGKFLFLDEGKPIV